MTPKSIADFRITNTVGEGSYSTVVCGFLRTEAETANRRLFAIKVLSKAHLIKHKKVKYAGIEKDALIRIGASPTTPAKSQPPATISSSSIALVGSLRTIRLWWAFQDAQSLYFIVDYVENRDLTYWLRRRTAPLSVKAVQFYIAEIVSALAWIHSKGVIHRDLKPDNILMTNSMDIKLADFGSARLIEDSKPEPDKLQGRTRVHSFVGTAEYVSPEVLGESGIKPEECIGAETGSDFWALGCIIYQLLTLTWPFTAATEFLIFQKILKKQWGWPEGIENTWNEDEKELGGQVKNLVAGLLAHHPKDRLGSTIYPRYGMEEILEQPCLASFDWTILPHVEAEETDQKTIQRGHDLWFADGLITAQQPQKEIEVDPFLATLVR